MVKQMSRKLVLLGLCLLVILSGALTACSSETKPTQGDSSKPKLEKTEVRLGVSVPDMAFLPIYFALENKLFEEEGLTVTLNSFKAGTDNTKALLSNSVDIIAGAFPESVLAPRTNGSDVKMFYGLYNQASYKWYSKKDIKSINDAKGKKFVVSKIGAQSDILTRWVVRRAGLDPAKDIQVVQGGGPAERLSALQSGAVDVAILTDPGTFVAEKAGYTLLLSLDQFIKNFPYEVYTSTPAFLKNNPETVKAFLRANNKAIAQLKKEPDKAMVAIDKYIKFSADDARKAYEGYKNGFPEDGTPALEGIDMLQDIAVEGGDQKQKYPVADLIDYTFINMFKK